MSQINVEIPGPGFGEIGPEDYAPDIQARYETTHHFFSSTASDYAVYVVSFGVSVGGNILASYLYDLIKKKTKTPPEKIAINRRVVVFEKGEIQKVIEETITHQKK
jgi:hypothetical protein